MSAVGFASFSYVHVGLPLKRGVCYVFYDVGNHAVGVMDAAFPIHSYSYKNSVPVVRGWSDSQYPPRLGVD